MNYTQLSNRGILPVLCLFILTSYVAAQNLSGASGYAELQLGEYEAAIRSFNARLAMNSADELAQRGLLRVYFEIGRYAEAEEAAKRFLSKHPGSGIVRHMLGEVYAATGRYGEAIAEFERASRDAAKHSNVPFARLESDLRRGEVQALVGRDDEARKIFQSLVTYYNENDPQTAPELTIVARALVQLEQFKEANDLYLAAMATDELHIDAHLGGGELFTEKYNYAEAGEFFREALAINSNSARAHLGIAANKRLEGGAEMAVALARALEINSNFVPARVLRATVELEASRYDAALSEIEAALKVNPNSLEARSVRAALLYLQDRDYEAEVKSTLAINPRYGAIYDTLSHFATITRRYGQAATFASRAVELQPRLWRGHLSHGIALLRLGRIDEGRAAVETSFKGDPFNVWAKNTLDLLDAMRDDYQETRQGGFLVKAATKEANVLTSYVAELLAEAEAKLTTKYRFKPQTPILVEVFPNHEDFAVRALGLPGLGALGVCFGQVIALDSPSARAIGEFNWGSTLWHEYTHVLTLQMTDYRVPRWFSEGLSVYEERRARPGWGDDWNPMVLQAFAQGRWFKFANLDAGFQQPRTPSDVPLAYFQASQVCEFIVERYGFDAILKMLALYRNKAKDADVLREALKLSTDEFDAQFKAYIEGKARPMLQAIRSGGGLDEAAAALPKEAVLKLIRVEDSFALRLRAGALLQAEGKLEEAAQHFKRAIELFPYYTSEGNAYEALALICEQQGDLTQASDVLEQLVKRDENNFSALKKLVELRLKQKDELRALEALQLSFFVSPFDYTLHTQAGELLLARNDAMGAAREFQVALALEPPNKAEANYNIARALFATGKQIEAKRAVLRALEAAPSYEEAQELLLKIVNQ